MKKIWIILLSLVFVAITSYAKEPENLFVAKARVIKYHDSGEYNADIAAVAVKAKAYLQERIAANKNNAKKLAIVFDIDETLLSEYDHWKKLGFGGQGKDFKDATDAADGKVIAPMLDLYNFAKNNNVAVFVITGRTESDRDATIKNLNADGYRNWDGLFFRTEDYFKNNKSIIPFKSSVRKKIVADGYDVVFSIGDQYSDSKGGSADQCFKLPNPYYYLP